MKRAAILALTVLLGATGCIRFRSGDSVRCHPDHPTVYGDSDCRVAGWQRETIRCEPSHDASEPGVLYVTSERTLPEFFAECEDLLPRIHAGNAQEVLAYVATIVPKLDRQAQTDPQVRHFGGDHWQTCQSVFCARGALRPAQAATMLAVTYLRRLGIPARQLWYRPVASIFNFDPALVFAGGEVYLFDGATWVPFSPAPDSWIMTVDHEGVYPCQ